MIDLWPYRKGKGAGKTVEDWCEDLSRLFEDNPWLDKLLSGEMVTETEKSTFNTDTLINGSLEVTDGLLVGTATDGVKVDLTGSVVALEEVNGNAMVKSNITTTVSQLYTKTENGADYRQISLTSSATSNTFQIVQETSGVSSAWLITTTSAAGNLGYTYNSVQRLKLAPSEADGAAAIAYLFDTITNLTNAAAKIASFKNSSSEKAYISAGGDLYLIQKTAPSVTTDKLYNVGGALYWAGTDISATSGHVTNGNSHDHAGGDGAQIDHGGLAGLGDDDHSIYLYLSGRSGQTISDTVGIGGAPDSKAQVTITSTTKGFLPPRLTTTEKNAISSPTEGLVLYDTTSHKLNYYNGSTWVEV